MTSTDHANLRLVETILRDIKGDTQYQTEQKRAEWLSQSLPKTSALIGVDWDGRERLTYR